MKNGAPRPDRLRPAIARKRGSSAQSEASLDAREHDGNTQFREVMPRGHSEGSFSKLESARKTQAQMTNGPNYEKRRILAPPHTAASFSRGEFVYDPNADWTDLRVGMVVERGGLWSVTYPPEMVGNEWKTELLSDHTRLIGRHTLIDYTDIAPPRGPPAEPAPWHAIAAAVGALLRVADRYRMRLPAVIAELKASPDVDADLVEDTLRMMVSMGSASISVDPGGTWLGVSQIVREAFRRKYYLATFSNELLAKSARIDHLIGHTGTVGSYREELLRNTLRQLMPTRYAVDTGFIENSPRQLDVLVWDTAEYGPLFREHGIVVVPARSVRAIIEVKTTLDTNALDDALEILHDVFRVDPPATPVFKGIFAYLSGYTSDDAVAARIKSFHAGAADSAGLIPRGQDYLFQGVTAVCVPHQHFVYQTYAMSENEESFPFPVLQSLEPDWPGDLRTAAFFAQILTFLDVDPTAKRTLLQTFMPAICECSSRQLGAVHGEQWRPTRSLSSISALEASGARAYVERAFGFFAGAFPASEILQSIKVASSPHRDAE